jgi:hypothetical protein
MKVILLKTVPFILISFAIYLSIATVLIIVDGKPKENISKQSALAFDELGACPSNRITKAVGL